MTPEKRRVNIWVASGVAPRTFLNDISPACIDPTVDASFIGKGAAKTTGAAEPEPGRGHQQRKQTNRDKESIVNGVNSTTEIEGEY